MFRSSRTLLHPIKYPLQTPAPPKIKGLYNLLYAGLDKSKAPKDRTSAKRYIRARKAKESLSHHQRNALKRYAWYLNVHKMRSQLVRQEQHRISLNDQKSIQQFKMFRRRVLDYRRKRRILSVNNILENERYHDILAMEKSRSNRERRQRRLNQLSVEETRRISGLRRLSKESTSFITPDNIDAHISRELSPNRLLMNTVFDGVRGVNDEIEYDLKLEEHFMNDKKDFEGGREFRDPLYPDTRIYPFGGQIHTDVRHVGAYERLPDSNNDRESSRDSSTKTHDAQVNELFKPNTNKNNKEKDPLVALLYGKKENQKSPQSGAPEERISREEQMRQEDPHLGIYHQDSNTPESMRKNPTQHYPSVEVHNRSIRRTKKFVQRDEILEKHRERIAEADKLEAQKASGSESWGGNALQQDSREKRDSRAMLDEWMDSVDSQHKKNRKE